MTRKTVHMGVSVSGLLRQSDKELQGIVSDDNGDLMSLPNAREWLRQQLEAGIEVLPMCETNECPDFHPVDGCPGHEIVESPLAVMITDTTALKNLVNKADSRVWENDIPDYVRPLITAAMDSDSDTSDCMALTIAAYEAGRLAPAKLRPLSEWDEDMGDVLWHRLPINEAPFVASPMSSIWGDDNGYTHFQELPAICDAEYKAALDLKALQPSECSVCGIGILPHGTQGGAE